ncbi:hypothetical protein [Agrococcus sp. ProA11]|uniref:hypothetical protein n=1 Tax=Agrococcus chionoecetis TaxID=3153752 RepID=UPI0032617C52
MDRHDEDARRWAPPHRRAVPGDGAEQRRDGDTAGDAPSSAAAPWTRGLPPVGNPTDASAGLASEIRPPMPPWNAPPAAETAQQREKSMLPLAIGVALLAALACVPHWVAPTIALMVALVGLPIAWGFRRISHGRRRVQYIVVVLTLLLVAALAVVAPLAWLQLGVLQPLTVPD